MGKRGAQRVRTMVCWAVAASAGLVPGASGAFRSNDDLAAPASSSELHANQRPPGAGPLPAVDEEQAQSDPTLTLDQINGYRLSSGDPARSPEKRVMRVLADGDRMKADQFFYIGEAYAKRWSYYDHRERTMNQKVLAAPPAEKPALEQERRTLAAQAQKWFFEASKAYSAATSAAKLSQYERADEVLVRFGSLLAAGKQDEQARELYLRVIKDYPKSERIPEAHLLLAELSFDRGDMDSALGLYEKVEPFPPSRFYAFAVYKQGWCHLKSGRHNAALETFVKVVRITQNTLRQAAVVTPLDRAALHALGKESKKDIVKAYAYVGAPEKARVFFDDIGGDDAPKMMRALSARYRRQGKLDAAKLLEEQSGR